MVCCTSCSGLPIFTCVASLCPSQMLRLHSCIGAVNIFVMFMISGDQGCDTCHGLDSGCMKPVRKGLMLTCPALTAATSPPAVGAGKSKGFKPLGAHSKAPDLPSVASASTPSITKAGTHTYCSQPEAVITRICIIYALSSLTGPTTGSWIGVKSAILEA